MTVMPSGEQFEIGHGSWRATVVEVGAGLRTLAAGDFEVLDGFPADEMDHDARGQILIPWPNRIEDGQYTFNGKQYQLPINETAFHNAIHGLVRWQNWQPSERAGNSITMTHRLYPQPGYPFALDLSATYQLHENGLDVTLRATNIGAEECPFGAGQHPYLLPGTALVNEASLQVPAERMYDANDRFIPTKQVSVDGTPFDFRQLRQIGDTALNTDYTDLQRGPDGRCTVVLQAPDGKPHLEVWMDEAFHHVLVYTGETVQPPSRRRQSLAIEPMSCPPNAFASGEDLVVLQPGQRWQGTWGISVRQ